MTAHAFYARTLDIEESCRADHRAAQSNALDKAIGLDIHQAASMETPGAAQSLAEWAMIRSAIESRFFGAASLGRL
jgi:hypothetical protein